MTTKTPMDAVISYGNDAPLVREILARPEAGPGQVLVRVKASGVNPLDLKIRSGKAPHAKHPLPAVLGMDLAGTVEAVGVDVTAFAPGDEVYGLTGGIGGLQGSLAEFAAVDADLLAPKPANLTMREAAALPLVFITAWEGLVDRARVRQDKRSWFREPAALAKWSSRSPGPLMRRFTPSTRLLKRNLIEELGATAIDRHRTTVEEYVDDHTKGRGFDVVYDTVGALDPSFNAVMRFGHVVSCLGWSTHSLAPLSFRAASYSGVFTLLPMLTGQGRAHHGQILREATRLSQAGKIAPRLDPRRYTLDSVTDAHRAIEDRSAAGKIVIDIAQ